MRVLELFAIAATVLLCPGCAPDTPPPASSQPLPGSGPAATAPARGAVSNEAAPQAISTPTPTKPARLAAAGGFTLWREGELLVLQARDGGRFRLHKEYPVEPSEVRLPGGYTVHLPVDDSGELNPEVRVFKQGKPAGTIPLGPIRDAWLTDDSLWGSREEANQARYYHNRAGVPPFFTDARAVGDAVWAIMRLYNVGASSHAQTILLEQVVRIDVTPKPELRVLRPLRGAGNAGVAMAPAMRVIRRRGSWLLHDPPELLHLRPDGVVARSVAVFPTDLLVQTLLDDRWLILRKSNYREPPTLEVLDLDGGDRSPRPLRGPWGKTESVNVADEGNRRLLLTASSYSTGTRTGYLVTLPSRQVVRVNGSLDDSSPYLWRDWLVLEGYDGGRAVVRVFDARTGKQIVRLNGPEPS
jgi:hypothetical protein